MIVLLALCFSLVSAGPNVLKNVLESPSGLAALFQQHVNSQGKHYAPNQLSFRLRVFRYLTSLSDFSILKYLYNNFSYFMAFPFLMMVSRNLTQYNGAFFDSRYTLTTYITGITSKR
jgi:hypothetical protein